jgi:hypothetical protein
MTFLAFAIGILLPAVNGWLAIRLIEGTTLVLLRIERWAFGFLGGLTATMCVTFLLAVSVRLPLTIGGFLSIQIVCLLLLAFAARWRVGPRFYRAPKVAAAPSHRMGRWTKAAVVILGLWTVAKIAAGAFSLVTLPPGFDDTVKNWDFRGKIFFVQHAISVTAPGSDKDIVGQLNSYPATVSLSKTWLAALAGRWDSGLVDSIHAVWFLAALVLLWALLRRFLSLPWALLGVYALASIPLYLVQGTQAYAEVFLSAHLLAAVGFLYSSVRAADAKHRLVFLRLAGCAMALLPFTKNEGLVLYLPLLLALTAGVLFHFWRHALLDRRSFGRALVWISVPLLAVALPWLAYKWSHGLVFGNAHSIQSSFYWVPMAPVAIVINLFFEGSWLLFFPFLVILFVLGWRSAFRSPLIVPAAFALAAFFVQLPLFLFTYLSQEVLYQTGYSRGLIHIIPVLVLVGVFLVHELLRKVES